MEKSLYLRKILAENIRSARASLHISQEKLAEHAFISVPYMRDIEYYKTWVSETTLENIARALNMEAYELLIPKKSREAERPDRSKTTLRKTTELVTTKKRELRKKVGEIMDDLILEIIQIHNKGE